MTEPLASRDAAPQYQRNDIGFGAREKIPARAAAAAAPAAKTGTVQYRWNKDAPQGEITLDGVVLADSDVVRMPVSALRGTLLSARNAGRDEILNAYKEQTGPRIRQTIDKQVIRDEKGRLIAVREVTKG